MGENKKKSQKLEIIGTIKKTTIVCLERRTSQESIALLFCSIASPLAISDIWHGCASRRSSITTNQPMRRVSINHFTPCDYLDKIASLWVRFFWCYSPIFPFTDKSIYAFLGLCFSDFMRELFFGTWSILVFTEANSALRCYKIYLSCLSRKN
jgi:hypothetical protein